jgi:NAD dependent epimerase/dehydratase
MEASTETSLSGRPVLVTGAGGFIGGHLVAELVAQGAKVRALVRYNSRNERGTLDWLDPAITSQVDVVLGELRDIESVRGAVEGTEVVFHLAAMIAIPYSYVNPRDFFETNVLGSLNVAQAALDAGVGRVVQTSTSEVYGTARFIPITEDHPLEPGSPYAASKVGADKLFDAYHRSYDLPVVILRPFNTYGPHQSARAIIPTIVSQAFQSDTLRLGSLDPRRDLTYVSDTVAGFVAAAQAPDVVGTTVQLGTGYDVSVRDIVETVGDVLGKELTVETEPERVRPPSSEVGRLISDPSFAQEAMGWESRVDLREGLARTIAWIEANQARFRTDHYVI